MLFRILAILLFYVIRCRLILLCLVLVTLTLLSIRKGTGIVGLGVIAGWKGFGRGLCFSVLIVCDYWQSDSYDTFFC